MSAEIKSIHPHSQLAGEATCNPIEDWDEYFLAIAEVVAQKSKDPRSQVGAVLASSDSVLMSTGFNGFARGIFDDVRLLRKRNEKLSWICHAEMNAIWNAGRLGVPLKGSTIYVNKFPCLACCNAIVQTGIVRIYTHDSKYWDGDHLDKDHSRKRSLLRQARIKVDAPFHPDFSSGEPITLQNIARRSPTGVAG